MGTYNSPTRNILKLLGSCSFIITNDDVVVVAATVAVVAAAVPIITHNKFSIILEFSLRTTIILSF